MTRETSAHVVTHMFGLPKSRGFVFHQIGDIHPLLRKTKYKHPIKCNDPVYTLIVVYTLYMPSWERTNTVSPCKSAFWGAMIFWAFPQLPDHRLLPFSRAAISWSQLPKRKRNEPHGLLFTRMECFQTFISGKHLWYSKETCCNYLEIRTWGASEHLDFSCKYMICSSVGIGLLSPLIARLIISHQICYITIHNPRLHMWVRFILALVQPSLDKVSLPTSSLLLLPYPGFQWSPTRSPKFKLHWAQQHSSKPIYFTYTKVQSYSQPWEVSCSFGEKSALSSLRHSTASLAPEKPNEVAPPHQQPNQHETAKREGWWVDGFWQFKIDIASVIVSIQ